MLLLLKTLVLIVTANGAPVLAQHLFANSFLSRPIDHGLVWFDQRPLLGPTKTWGGMLASLMLTPVLAWMLDLPLLLGFIIAALAMSGDLLSSLTKRRLGYPASTQAIGLDQIPESLLPLLYVTTSYQLPVVYALVGVIVFIVLELLLSKILYKLGIRKHPY